MRGMEMLVPMILEGLKTTIGVFIITLVLSLPLSLLVANLRMSNNKLVKNIAASYIYVMRGTPLLLQMMFIFFGLPLISKYLTLDRYLAILLAFILNYAAYFAEIFRSGINAISLGQYEAAKVLGLPKAFAFKKIILPQVMRNIMPSISNEVISLVKDTSLVYILGVADILKAAKSVSNTYATFGPYVVVAIVYLILVAIIGRILTKVEDSYNYFR